MTYILKDIFYHQKYYIYIYIYKKIYI